MSTITNPHSDIASSLQTEVENIDAAPPWNAHTAADEVMRRLGMTPKGSLSKYDHSTTYSWSGGHVEKRKIGTASVCVYTRGGFIHRAITEGCEGKLVRLVEFAWELEREAGGE